MSINDITVDTRAQLIGAIGQYRPGDKVVVKVMRGDKERNITVTLANMHGKESIVKGGESFYNERLGLVLEPLSQEMKNTVKKNYGLKIVEVKDGIFKRKGLNNDCIILTVNNQKVSSEQELNTALSSGRNGKVRIEMTDISGDFLTVFEFYSR